MLKMTLNARLQDTRGITLVAVLMLMAILLSVIGAGLLFSGINTKIVGNYQIGTKAFYAADSGLNAAMNQLAADPAVATVAVSGTVSSGLSYRSGHLSDGTAQPLQYKGTLSEPGYSLNAGTGYNSTGYTFYQYQINMTGAYNTSWGTAVAGREVEAQARYGPVAR
jgi:Tfp pilus assembly protein PilX